MFRFSFSSPITPELTFDYHLSAQRLQLQPTPHTTSPALSAELARLACYRVMVPVPSRPAPPSLHSATEAEAEAGAAEAEAGVTLVPITLVHSKEFKPKHLLAAAAAGGSQSSGGGGSSEASPPRALLYRSYGAYGTEMDLSFHAPYLSLLNRGWVIAYAHIRYTHNTQPTAHHL